MSGMFYFITVKELLLLIRDLKPRKKKHLIAGRQADVLEFRSIFHHYGTVL